MGELNKTNDVNNAIEKINGKISDYLTTKADVLDNDYVEVLGDVFSLAKGVFAISKFVVKKRFEYFLRGFCCESGPTFEQLCKLYDYIDNEERAEFISNMISKVLNGASKNATFLMGIVVQRLVNANKDFTYRELVAINALSELFDYDIDNLIIVKKYLIHLNETRNSKSKKRIIWATFYWKFREWCKEIGIELDGSLELTLEKCASNQLLVKSIENELDIDDEAPSSGSVEALEYYKFSEAGLLLNNYFVYLDIL